MKTDKFDDAIRRKLESIEPPFRERDWSHMQDFMHRHGYPPSWAGASQWLIPVAAAASVVGLIVSAVWQFHTNQQLSQSVQALSQTVSRLESTQAKLIKLQNRTDTVYVTNFTKTPVPTPADQPIMAQSVHQQPSRPLGDRYTLQPGTSPVDHSQLGTESGVQPVEPLEQPLNSALPTVKNRLAQRETSGQKRVTKTDELAGNTNTSPATATQPSINPPTDAASRSNASTERQPGNAPTTTGSANPTSSERVVSQRENTPNRSTAESLSRSEGVSERGTSGTGGMSPQSALGHSESSQPATNQTYAGTRSSDRRKADQRFESGSPTAVNQEATTIRQLGPISLLTGRPLMIEVDSAHYAESIARRTRRIRSLLPATVAVLPTSTAPTEVNSSRPNFKGVRLRLGVSGEAGNVQTVVGAYSELLIGKHWSVGVGLNRLSLQGGQFANADQFKSKTSDDFRRIYAPRIDPVHDIIDIDREFTLWQIPINVSYRALLGKGFALTPSVGMDFSLSVQESTTFTYRRGPYEYTKVPGMPPSRPCDLFNSYTVAIGGEKSWKHIVLQAGPVLSTPVKSLPDQINPISVGLRTRILFQF